MSGGPVLVVDDDATSRNALVQALAEAGFAHATAASGPEALAQIQRVRPSVILLDLVMPAPDGLQILRILRSRSETSTLPVVVLTALEGDEEISRAFEAGADDFVRKPVKVAEVIARVRSQLRLRRAMEELRRKDTDAEVVLELTQALASNLEFRRVLSMVVQRIAQIVSASGIDRVSIVLVRDRVGDEPSVGYVVAASDDEQLRDLPIDLTRYPEIQRVLATGEPLFIEDAAAEPLLTRVREEPAARRWSSLAIVPILYDGRPMGVLFLRSTRRFSFGEQEIGLCRTIGGALAIALRNARILQTLRDQTHEVTVARFEAERRLKSLQKYADFFESAADGIIVIDHEGRLLFSNPRARTITGYDEGDLKDRRIGDIVAPEDRERAHEIRLGFSSGRFPQAVDLKILQKGGRAVLVNVNHNPVLREESVVLCSFRDVTAERAVAAELVKTKAFLERVIDSSLDAVISIDMRGIVLVFNRAAERIYGKPGAEVLGRNIGEIYPPGTAQEIMRLMRKGGGRVEGLRTEILDATGETVPVLLSASLIYDGDRPIGSVGLFTDLRERMRMERRLARAQEQILAQERQSIIAELAGATAHELNQPLQSVMGYAELLTRTLKADASSSRAADVIFGEAQRMAEIVRKIGKITKYETKSYVGQARILDLDRASSSPESTPVVETGDDDAK